MRYTIIEDVTPKAFAKFCRQLADNDQLFRLDDRDEMLFELFSPEDRFIVGRNLHTAEEVLAGTRYCVFHFALMALDQRNALHFAHGSAEQIDELDRFFDLAKEYISGDVWNELEVYFLKATTEEMINATYNALPEN